MKTQMPFSNEIEKTKKEIEVLTKKLSFLEELEKTKTPCEKAFKRVYGYYSNSNESDTTWIDFKFGYNAAQEDYKVGDHQKPAKEEPVKQKDTLYDLLEDFLQYSDHKETVCKIVRDWLDQNTTIVEEDYSTVTLKLKKGSFGDAN